MVLHSSVLSACPPSRSSGAQEAGAFGGRAGAASPPTFACGKKACELRLLVGCCSSARRRVPPPHRRPRSPELLARLTSLATGARPNRLPLAPPQISSPPPKLEQTSAPAPSSPLSAIARAQVDVHGTATSTSMERPEHGVAGLAKLGTRRSSEVGKKRWTRWLGLGGAARRGKLLVAWQSRSLRWSPLMRDRL